MNSVLFQLFFQFSQIGILTIGGGYALIPLMQEVILSRNWLPESVFVDMLAVSEMTPGPIGTNFATYAGYNIAGIPGSLIATVSSIILPFLLVLFTAPFLLNNKDHWIHKALFYGIKPIVGGLIIAAALTIGNKLLITEFASGVTLGNSITALVFLGALALSHFKKTSPLILISLGALIGVLKELII